MRGVIQTSNTHTHTFAAAWNWYLVCCWSGRPSARTSWLCCWCTPDLGASWIPRGWHWSGAFPSPRNPPSEISGEPCLFPSGLTRRKQQGCVSMMDMKGTGSVQEILVTSPRTHVSRVTIWAAHHVLLFDEHGPSTRSSRPTWRLSIHRHGPLEGPLRSWTVSRTP